MKITKRKIKDSEHKSISIECEQDLKSIWINSPHGKIHIQIYGSNEITLYNQSITENIINPVNTTQYITIKTKEVY